MNSLQAECALHGVSRKAKHCLNSRMLSCENGCTQSHLGPVEKNRVDEFDRLLVSACVQSTVVYKPTLKKSGVSCVSAGKVIKPQTSYTLDHNAKRDAQRLGRMVLIPRPRCRAQERTSISPARLELQYHSHCEADYLCCQKQRKKKAHTSSSHISVSV